MDRQQIDGSILEKSLAALPGIRGARVVIDSSGFESIRVLAIPERSTPGVIDDVVTLVRQQGGEVSPDAIQVLRVGEVRNGIHRRRLSSVHTDRSGERFTARVALELGGDILVGEVDGPAGPRSEYRSMASATLDGVRRMLDIQVDLESVQIFQLGNDRLASVVLNVGENTLAGSAMVRLDEYDAIVRATLDALNRTIARAYVEQAP